MTFSLFMMTLYATAGEQQLIAALSESIRAAFHVLPEEQENYETPEQLFTRSAMLRRKYPDMQQSLAQVALTTELGKKPDLSFLAGASEGFIMDFFFTIGAVGISLYVHVLLQQASEKVIDWNVVANLTEYRHRLLSANARIPSVLA